MMSADVPPLRMTTLRPGIKIPDTQDPEKELFHQNLSAVITSTPEQPSGCYRTGKLSNLQFNTVITVAIAEPRKAVDGLMTPIPQNLDATQASQVNVLIPETRCEDKRRPLMII